MHNFTKKCSYLGIFILMVSLLLPTSSVALSNSDFDAMVQKAEERRVAMAQTMEASTVFIIARINDSSIEMGTGFIVKENYVLTNAHVIDGSNNLFIVGKNFAPVKASLVKKLYNDDDDFALLKFDQPLDLPVLSFNLSLGRTDKVSAWGYPYLVTQFDQNMDTILEGKYKNLPPVVYTEGVVSAFVQSSGGQAIIHSASVSPGNSGGPLINNQGHVVGINTWIASTENRDASINAALPAHAAIKFLRSCNLEPRIAESHGPILAMQENTPARPFESHAGTTTQGSLSQVPSFFRNSGDKAAPSLDNKSYPSEQAAAQLTGQAKELYPAALAGDADAQAYIGASYYLGDEAPELEDEAIYWLKKSAAQGNLTGISTLGAVYVQSVPYKNINEGLKLVRKAVAQDADYAHILAHFLLRGESLGVPHDAKGGFEAALKGAEADNVAAIGLLAYAYAMGYGVECDEAHALDLAEIAAEEEDALAYAVISYLSCIGGDIEEDLEISLEYAKAAANADEAMGYGLLALHYIIENTPDMSAKEALEFAEKGAAQADELSQFVMGMFCLDEDYGREIDLSLSWAYFELAAQKNFAFAVELRNELADALSEQDIALGKQYIQLWHQDWGL